MSRRLILTPRLTVRCYFVYVSPQYLLRTTRSQMARLYAFRWKPNFSNRWGFRVGSAPATVVIELSGAGCLLLGIVARYVALLLIPLILGSIVTVHGKNGWHFTNTGGGWEYPAFWAAALLVQFLVEDGALTLLFAHPPCGHLTLTGNGRRVFQISGHEQRVDA